MSCRIEGGRAILPNGKDSKLYDKLKQEFGHKADNIYETVYGEEFKKFWGSDFQKDVGQSQIEQFGNNLDENNEPILYSDVGMYEFMNPKGETFQIAEVNRDNSKALDLGGRSDQETVELQEELINTAVYVINTIKSKANLSETQVSQMFDNGVLKNELLKLTFKNKDLSNETMLDLYNTLINQTNGYDKFEKKRKDLGIELTSNWDVFIWAYQQYEPKLDSLDNETTLGTRDLIKSGLSKYNQSLKDGEYINELIDEEFVKIYGQSRIQDNPKDKLSGKARAILSNIELGINSLGYPRILTTDLVYATIAEAAVGKKNFAGMIQRLDHVAKYKPEAQAIVNKLRAIPVDQQSVIFSTFKNTYKNFVFYQQIKNNEGVYENRVINSNLSDVRNAAIRDYKRNSEEHIQENNRAIYKMVGDKRTVKPEKLRRAQNAWEIVNDARGQVVWTEEQINALGTYLWELGMNYGPTLETTQEYLKLYHSIGDEQGSTGGIALTKFAIDPNLNFGELIKFIEDNPKENFHTKKSTIVKKIADLNLLFSEQPFGSFISGALKQMYPVNTPTSLDELSELINDPEQETERKEYFDSLRQTALFSPGGKVNTKYDSVLLQVLEKNSDARKRFKNYNLDSYKSVDRNEAVDYGGQSPINSLIVRMLGFQNRGSEKYSYVAVPTQADRNNFSQQEMPKALPQALKKHKIDLSKPDIIDGLIIQDLARMNQAKKLEKEAQASGDTSKLIKGYHYKNTPYDRQGSVYTMPQIYGNTNTKVNNIQDASDLLDSFLDGSNPAPFQKILTAKRTQVNLTLRKYEDKILADFATYDIKPVRDISSDLNTEDRIRDFISDFVFNDFVMRIELNKFTRGGFLGKNTSDYYKRMGLLNTPGTKLAIQGDLKDPSYGMMPTYKALVIKDFNYVDVEGAQQVVENLKDEGLDSAIADLYGPFNSSFQKTDAQSFISIDMYRGLMQGGMGEWSKEDEDAYNEYKKGGDYNRPVKPLKPYHEQTNVKNGINYMHMDKNSFTVITPEFAKGNPYYESMLNVMRNGIHVVHSESATKGMRSEPQDFQNTLVLDTSNPMVMDSRKLRFPQTIPTNKTPDDGLTFNRQLRKNIITNVEKNGDYNVAGKTMKGFEMQQLFFESIAANIAEDTNKVNNDLGFTQVRAALGNNMFNKQTLKYKRAKLAHLKKLREAIRREIQERGLPQNYLDGLDIVPMGPFDYDFRIPLSYPHYASRYENIISKIQSKGIYEQKLRGMDVVQIAELGGYTDDSGQIKELRMYDGKNGGAEVRIKASLLGFTAEEIEGKTAADFAGDPRLEFIGFRIPQQGKNSAMVFRTVEFLPESYEKAIMVPGGIVVQMGADFDIDKLNLIFKETGKLNKRQERDNTIYDIFKAIILDKKHLTEVMTPVDNKNLSVYQVERADADYNDPGYEVEMERIQKMGIAGRGLWSNFIAGRNTGQVLGVLSVDPLYAPQIDGAVYNTITTKDLTGKYTDANISEYLSAAVDAAKDPIQIDINDNKYTIPVAGLMLMVGLPIQTVVGFLQHPAIVDAIKKAQDQNLREDALLSGIVGLSGGTDLSSAAILDQSLPDDVALTTFKAMHTAGKQLQRVNKIITPDNLDNVNELSSILSWLEEESFYLNNEQSLIYGADEYIQHQKNTKVPLHASNVAYRGIFDTILKNADDLGFIQNSAAVNQAKKHLKRALDITVLSPEQHKFIDRALYRFIMTQPHSPLAALTSRETIFKLYSPESETNLVKRTQELGLKYPRLYSNRFFRLLKPDNANPITRMSNIVLDTSTDLSTSDKNALSNGLLAMLKDSEQEIKDFGKALVSNQLITTGFNPTYGSYIDLIPAEVLTTDILNPGKGSPVQFFKEEKTALLFSDYVGFANFTHEFVRNFGLQRPGGRDLVPKVTKFRYSAGRITLAEDALPAGKRPAYIKAEIKSGIDSETKLFFNEGTSYQELSPLGKAGKIFEINTGENSIFKSNVTAFNSTARPNVPYIKQVNLDKVDKDNDTDIQPDKVCKT